MMADLMTDLQKALTDLMGKKNLLDVASEAVKKASTDYENSKSLVVKLRLEVNRQLDHQLSDAGVSLADSRVSQSE